MNLEGLPFADYMADYKRDHEVVLTSLQRETSSAQLLEAWHQRCANSEKYKMDTNI